MPDPLANGPRELIVCPVTSARFRIGSDIRRKHLSGEALKNRHVLASAERVRQNGCISGRPVVLRVAPRAVCHSIEEIFTAGYACRRALKSPRRQRARPRTDKRPPADG